MANAIEAMFAHLATACRLNTVSERCIFGYETLALVRHAVAVRRGSDRLFVKTTAMF